MQTVKIYIYDSWTNFTTISFGDLPMSIKLNGKEYASHCDGLVIRSARDMNEALLAKSSWRIYQDDPSLWVKMCKQMYLKHASSLTNNETCRY